MSTINPAQVNTSIFGMASAVFTSMCAALVTTAVKGNTLIDKSANTLIHGVSAAENVAEAVERRSKIYGDGIVRNGELAERETTLKYKLRLTNLERQEQAVANGAAYTPDPSFADKLQAKLEEAKNAVVGSDTASADGSVKITPAVATRS
jgi:hypothetical protein